MLIQELRSVIIKYQLGLFIAIAFLFFSCKKDSATNTGTQNSVADKATDEDYFNAVFFLDGPLASAISDYQELSVSKMVDNDKALKGIRDLEAKMIKYIKTNYAGFLNDFRTKITSNDYSQVSAAMKDGGKKILEALNHLNGRNMLDDEIGKAVVQEFTNKYGSLENMSKADLAKNIKNFYNDSNGSNSKIAEPVDAADWYYEVDVTVHTKVASVLYVGVAVAVLLILVIPPAAVEPTSSYSPFAKTASGFAFDDYSSAVTIGLAGK